MPCPDSADQTRNARTDRAADSDEVTALAWKDWINSKWFWAAFSAAAAAVLLMIALFGGHSPARSSFSEEELTVGRAALQALEAADPEQVDERIRQYRLQELLEYRDEMIAQLENGEIDVWSCFENSVLLGDSRGVGFSFYNWLPENRVFAEGGATIRHLKQNLSRLTELQPDNLFLCYGLNDVSIGYWPSPEDYVEEFREIIRETQEALPGVTIYISSILPAQEIAFETEGSWRRIPEYSSAVEAMCEDLDGVCFVNNDALAEEKADLYDPDGIHLRREFYPYWATNMIREVFMYEIAEGSKTEIPDGE